VPNKTPLGVCSSVSKTATNRAALCGRNPPTHSLDTAEIQPPQRCGLVAIVGRPNVGKSTLLNALVGQKISITSNKAQTTRHRITGIRTEAGAQCVFVDTPGFQTQHGNALNRNLNRTVRSVLSDVDVVLFVVEAGKFTLADAKVLALLPEDKPVLLVANKLDEMKRRDDVLPWLASMRERRDFTEFVPLSATGGHRLEALARAGLVLRRR
jgi:GTPase